MIWQIRFINDKNVKENLRMALRKKCRYSELFWFAFTRIWNAYEEYSVSLRIQSECRKMGTRITPNMDTFQTEL